MPSYGVTRTLLYTFEGVAPASPAATLVISSANIVGFPPGGVIVGWDVQNTETTTGNIIRCRLGPAATAITLPVGAPSSTTLGNAVPLDAGRTCSFSRSEDRYDTADATVWGVLIVLGYGGNYSFTGVATVLLPPGVGP